MALRLQRPDEQPQLRLAQPRVAQTISIRQARPAPAQTVPTRQIQPAQSVQRNNVNVQRPQQPTPQIKKPTVNQATLTGRNLKTAAGMALTPGGAPLAPAALLGAFDKEGPFSAYHQQQFKNVTNPVTSKLQEYNDWVNKDDPTEGFQINSLGDWGRLGRTLLPSMALGMLEAPVKSAEAASGSGIRNGEKTDLTPVQRVGSGADAGITVAGIPFGGSGTFMKSLLPNTAKTLAPAGGNLLKTLASGTWNIAKDAGKEVVEEVVQTFASDLSDDSRVNTPLTQYRDAGVTGAAGGTLFSGAGKTIEFTKSVPSRVDTSIHNNLSKNDPNYQSLLFEREYTTNNLEKTAIDQKLQKARQQVITQAPGKVVNKAKTDIESLQQIPHERTIQHPKVQAIAEQGDVLRQHRTDLMNRGLSYNSPAVKAVENAMRELGKEYNATYKRVYEQTKQEMLEPLIKANEFTRNHLIPGGTLAGPLAGDFSKAQEQGLVFDGVDGKPRFEIDDSGAKINIDALKPYAGTSVSYAKLSELLDHPQLFDNYPNLRDVEVASTPSVKGVENARIRAENYIEINPKLLKDPAKLKSTLLHEIQHSIQGKEGFAGGADPATAGKDMTKAQAVKREKLQKQFADAQRAGTDTKGILNEVIQLENDIGYDAYFRSAGEAEARAVQARMNMPMSERYVDGKNTLDDSLDVPKEDLIIKNGDGKAMSVEPKDPKSNFADLDTIIKAYKQSPTGVDINAVKKAYADDAKAIKMLEKAQAEVKVERAKQAVQAKREREYGNELNSLANRTQILNDDGTLDTKSISEFHKAEYELAKKYPDIGDNANKITYYESKQPKPTLQTALEGKTTKIAPDNANKTAFRATAIVNALGADGAHGKLKLDDSDLKLGRQLEKYADDIFYSKDYSNLEKADRIIEQLTQKHYPDMEVGTNGLTRKASQQSTPTLTTALEGKSTKVTRQAPTSDQSNTKPQDKQVKSTAQKVQQTPKSDTPALVQPKKVTGQSPATQTSTKGDVSSANNTTKSKFTKEQLEAWDNANLEADRKNTAVTYGKKKKTDMLTDAIERSAKINKAAKQAVDTGKELHFYAKTDDNGRSVGIERFNPDKTKIEAGFVVDSYGKIIGNHIKVDNTGVQVNIGGELVNIEKVIGNPLEWKGKYRVSETMSRNIDRNAPSKEIADKTKSFLITSKYKAEARFRTELHNEYKNLSDRIKATKDAKPRGVDMKTYQDDIFSVLNGDTTLSDIKGMYPTETYTAIKDYHDTTRSLYDTLLERVNNERVKFGQQPIEKRQNYITHLQELSNNKDFVGDAFTTMKNSFLDDMNMKTRGGVPGEIAGRTENFKPISAYNRFLQRRTGEASLRDPFQAVQEYLEPALYNIHMTETTARARAIESAFRTADQIKRMQPDQVTKDTSALLYHYRRKGDTSKLITGFQEYANALGRKTQRWDRQVIDSSDAMGKSIRGWQYLQRRGGQATIIGNVSSVMMQPLNQVVTLADAGPKNYLRGIVANVAGDTAIEKSAFIKARATQVNKPIRGVGGKILDAGGMPLQEVEMAAVKQTWHAMHTKAKADGYKGQQAIDKADLDTERLVAGRGIADRPELYRSSIANGFLQFTLEVNAQYKAFTQDLNVGQKATFMVAAMALNELYENINGQTPLPDFLTPVIEAMLGLADDEDDKSAGQELAEMTQKLFGEAVSMNPISSSIASAALTQEQREQVFGEDANVARFEGTAAPIQLVRNVYDAGKAAVEGDWKTARDKGLKTVPFGNQAQKTIRGAEANRDGYVAGPSGRVMFETGTNPVDATKNLLFGPYSTKNSVNFFNSKASPFGEKQSETIRSLSGAARTEYMDTIRKLREAGLKATESNIQKASSGTSLEALKAPKKADTGWMDEYNAAKSTFEKESKNWSTVERAKKEKELATLEVKKEFSKDVTSLYGMAERDIYGLLDSLDEKEANKYLTQAVAYADKMVEAGLWTTNKLRDKNGNIQYDRNYNAKQAAGGSRSTSRTSSRTSTRKTSTRKSSGTRTAKGKFDYKLFGFMPKSRDTSSELYDLLKKAKMKSSTA